MTMDIDKASPTATLAGTIGGQAEVYWIAGCTGCLRMKEFVEKSGIAYRSIDVGADEAAQQKLTALGAKVPSVVLGDRWVPGADLVRIAELLGFDYSPPVILPAPELVDRYRLIMETLCRLVSQADPATLQYRRPERDRTLLSIGYHAASVMRTFLLAYDEQTFEGEPYIMTIESPVPDKIADAETLVAHATETLAMFDRWWERYGRTDPLDRIIEVYWGYRTIHEGLEREVWHTAQHTRQVALFLEESGIAPDRALGPAELAGLPVPERVFV